MRAELQASESVTESVLARSHVRRVRPRCGVRPIGTCVENKKKTCKKKSNELCDMATETKVLVLRSYRHLLKVQRKTCLSQTCFPLSLSQPFTSHTHTHTHTHTQLISLRLSSSSSSSSFSSVPSPSLVPDRRPHSRSLATRHGWRVRFRLHAVTMSNLLD